MVLRGGREPGRRPSGLLGTGQPSGLASGGTSPARGGARGLRPRSPHATRGRPGPIRRDDRGSLRRGPAGGGGMSGYDAIVVGGGHNGLTAAAYLARAGKRVAVLERRPILGGACVTEEVWPGQRVSRASYVVSMLNPRIV